MIHNDGSMFLKIEFTSQLVMKEISLKSKGYEEKGVV